MRWLAAELHTHTYHSDGKQTLEELASGAKKMGLECIALTDHNTMAGLLNREAIELDSGITIIPGMEWTTFYGHMLTIGQTDFVDWRLSGPTDIDRGILRVHERGGLAGMAHPFRVGSPMCTGCHWEYKVEDWNILDFIEVWSGTFPSIKTDNQRAFALWTDRLNAGYRISATSGRDWHSQAAVDEPVSVTYLGLEDGQGTDSHSIESNMAVSPYDVVHSLAGGRVSVTIGPLVILVIDTGDRIYGVGECVPAASAEDSGNNCEYAAQIDLLFSARQQHWELAKQIYTLRITGNTGLLAERIVETADDRCRISIPGRDLIWARAELWGIVQGIRTLIAFTNAVYFNR